MTTNNVIEFPKIFNGNSPQAVADALKDFVKDKPNAQLIVIIKDDDEDMLSMGWNPMDSAAMSLMLKFADYKFMQRTFLQNYLEVDPDDEDDEE